MNKWVNPAPRKMIREVEDERNYTSYIPFDTIKEQVGKKKILGKPNMPKRERIMEVVERLINNIQRD